MTKWQPIKTAPKDRDFLAQLGNGYITRARFHHGRWFASDSCGPQGGRVNDTEPYYWQELPEAHVATESGDK